MGRSSWLNAKRIRDYPRLIFIASWAVLIMNFVLHDGWLGGLTGKLFAGDFISNYAGGVIYTQNIDQLYDPDTQYVIQADLIAPSLYPEGSPFISPPYVALAYSWLSFLPLSTTFVLWEILNIICVVFSCYLCNKFILPTLPTKISLSTFQLSVIVLSSFAFLEGFLYGQSHGITMLLCTGIVVATIKEKWLLAGFLGSISTFKPQFVIGFLICWLVWGCLKALLSFVVFTFLWQIPVLLTYGLTPYLDYRKLTHILFNLPYAEEGYAIPYATPYGLLATLLPIEFSNIFILIFSIFVICFAIYLAYIAYKSRHITINQRYYVMAMAMIFPLIVAPHVLDYDLLILLPIFALLVNYVEMHDAVKYFVIFSYAGMLIFYVLSHFLHIALLGIIPLMIMIFFSIVYIRSYRKELLPS